MEPQNYLLKRNFVAEKLFAKEYQSNGNESNTCDARWVDTRIS